MLGDGIPTIMVDGEANPHFWLDPSLVATRYVPAIAAALTTLDPAGGATYAANAAAYTQQLEALDAANKAKIEKIPAANRKLVTFHDAFPYFAAHYGFELVGVILPNVGQEPSASQLAALVAKVKAANVKAVFSEAQFSPELAHTLAQEAGITRVVTTLYNDTVGPPPNDTYLKMMAWNIEQIVRRSVTAGTTSGSGQPAPCHGGLRGSHRADRCRPRDPDRLAPGRHRAERLRQEHPAQDDLGVLAPFSGSVEIFGGPARLSAKRIAYVPQAELVDWSFPVTVGDVVMMGRVPLIGIGRSPGRADREAVAEALETVRMADERDRQIGALSGGQRRRVFLAKALAAHPTCISSTSR